MIEKITRIFHIADIHCRTYKRHLEYKNVFDKFFKYVDENKDDESIIVIAGDIVHSKLEMSPELIDLVSYLFKGCSALCPTIVFIGNHDTNLNNSFRMDALTPIVDALNLDNLYYWKDAGIFKLGDIEFAHFSLLEEKENWPKVEDIKSKTKIGLYHGIVSGCSLDNMSLTSDVSLIDFDGFDIVLLGDIHKRQILSKYPAIQYPGSLIQQNFGEELTHGFLVWDIPTRTSKFVPIQNDIGYVTLEIQNGKILNKLEEYAEFKKLRVRLKYTNTTPEQLTKIISKLSTKFQIPEIVYHRQHEFEYENSTQNISGILGNIRDIDYQNKLLTEFLSVRGATKKQIELIRNINAENNIENQILGIRNHIWKLKTFEFSNMFSYGENNVIDFTDFNGIYGLFAPNASGKSALLDSLMFCLFDKTSRTYKAKHVLNNKKTEFSCKLHFELNNTDYFIERTGIYNERNDNVKVEVNFYYIDPNGEVVSLNGQDRDETNKHIREFIGTYDDFILTTLSSQTDNQSFIDKSQRDRKELLYKFLDLSIFELLYKTAKENIRSIEVLIKELSNVDLHTEIEVNKKKLTDLKSRKADLKHLIKLEKDNIKNAQNRIIALNKDIRDIQQYSITKDEAETKIARTTIILEELASKLTKTNLQLSDINSEIKHLEDQIKGIQIDELFKNQTIRKEIEKEILVLENEHSILESKINHNRNIISQLESHQYDPNCEFCIQNSFVIDARKSEQLLITNLNNLEAIKIQLSEKTTELDLIENPTNLIAMYSSITSKLPGIRSKQSALLSEIENIRKKGNELNSQLKEFHSIKLNYIKNEVDILHNSKIQLEIQNLEEINKQSEISVNSYTRELAGIDGNILYISKILKEIQDKKTRLSELSDKYAAYEYYLEAMSRDGIAYELLKKSIPVIESEVNDVLSQIVDFRIRLETTDDNYIHAYIIYNTEKNWPVELTSGMERFILSIAFRVSMIKITTLSRSNFIALDEGFGVLDSDKISSLNLLFEYLKSEFQYILCISHIDSMKDLADHNIVIEKENGFSKLAVE